MGEGVNVMLGERLCDGVDAPDGERDEVEDGVTESVGLLVRVKVPDGVPDTLSVADRLGVPVLVTVVDCEDVPLCVRLRDRVCEAVAD